MVVLYYNLNTISIAILRKNIAFLRIFGVFKGKNRVFRDEGLRPLAAVGSDQWSVVRRIPK